MIFESFATASEIINYFNTFKIPGLLLKLDFEKAFDSVSLNFLFSLLERRGFGSNFVSWISSIIKDSTSVIFINGSLGNWFPIKKGLKQGNSLSPLLFILVGNLLHRMLDLAMSEELLESVGPAKLSSYMHSIKYAGDIVIFSKASKHHLNNIKLILYFFELLTGLKIDFS